MIRKPIAVFLLLLMMVGSSVFFIAPQKTYAQSIIGAAAGAGAAGAAQCYLSSALSSLLGSAPSAITSVPVFDTANLSVNTTAAGSTLESCIFNTVLVPIARAIARAILQQITASTINWINGSNGTGQPSYIQNLAVHLQGVGDSFAVPFIAQIRSNAFNSPFSSAIAAALSNNYAQQTSVQGFYAQNQCTLSQSSPNVNAYLAGNWSQGGVGTWFALTTEPNNNPYTVYQASQVQLGSGVSQAQTNRRQDLIQSGGYLSWCGPNQVGSGSQNQGTYVYDSCTNPDGSTVAALTPGSIVARYANKTIVDSGIDQLISVNDLDSALGAIITALVNQVLGVGGQNGLYGASAPSPVGTARPFTTQLQTYAANNSTAASSANSIAQGALANVTAYTNAWQTVLTAANTAQTTVTALASFCTTSASALAASTSPIAISFVATANAQAAAANTALSSEINPVIVQANNAITSAAQTQAFATQVQQEASQATSITTASAQAATTLISDTQKLAAMPPSATDVTLAQQNAQTTSGGAQASPAGSLSVSGGTLVDQMNLINTNATALHAACIPPP